MRSHARAGEASSSSESPGTLLHEESELGDDGVSSLRDIVLSFDELRTQNASSVA